MLAVRRQGGVHLVRLYLLRTPRDFNRLVPRRSSLDATRLQSASSDGGLTVHPHRCSQTGNGLFGGRLSGSHLRRVCFVEKKGRQAAGLGVRARGVAALPNFAAYSSPEWQPMKPGFRTRLRAYAYAYAYAPLASDRSCSS